MHAIITYLAYSILVPLSLVFASSTDSLAIAAANNYTTPIYVSVVGSFASDPTLCVGPICATSQITLTYNILTRDAE